MLWVVLLASLSVADEPPSRTALIYVGLCVLVIAAGWAAFAAGWPGALSPGDVFRFKGIIRHEQTMAFCAISAFLGALVWTLNRRRVDAPAHMLPIGLTLALCLATIVATQARSFTTFFVLSLFAAWFFHLQGARRLYVLIAGLVVGGGLFLALDVLLPLLSRGNENQDVTLSGVQLKAGELATLLLGAANTDDEHFTDAQRVDFARERNIHAAFGAGPHRCLGSHLARMELRVAMEVWHERIPHYRIKAGETPRFSPAIREAHYLPLVWA